MSYYRLMSTARTFCELSDWRLSNLPLQKLVYLAHMVHLGEHKTPLVEGAFEAWDLGPVHPVLYRKARAYGDKPVQNVFGSELFTKGTSQRKAIDFIATQLLDAQPSRLIAITHQAHGAWAEHYKPHVMGIEIPNEAIAKEYQKRLRRPTGN